MKKTWSRGDKLTVGGLVLAVITTVAAILVVPEFRQFFHLDKQQTAQAETRPTPQSQPPSPAVQTGGSSQEPSKPTPAKPKKTPKTTHKTTTHVTGNDNVAGNNVSGDHNVTGNNNQTGATANAPNGIAIVGPATVTNPTVNNFGPPPKTPAVVTVCVGESQAVVKDAGHDGEFRRVLTLTTDSSVDNPTYGFQFSGTILRKGSASSSPDMAMNVKEGVTTPTSFAFVIYQTWYPGQRINVEVYSHEAVSLVNALGKHSESFTVKNGDCNSSL